MILPEVVRPFAEANSFVPTEELPGGHCSRVFADARRVLKLALIGEELTTGFVASTRIAAAGGVEVLAADAESRAILMPRLWPGTKLSHAGLTDEAQVTVFCGFARRIQTLDPSGLMPLAEYFEYRDALLDWLLATTGQAVFLHGDLHHENVLRGGDRWVMIDPKGVVGDAAFECNAYLRNPMDQIRDFPDFVAISRRRIRQMTTELDLDPRRIWAWSMVDMRSGEAERDADSPWWIVQRAMETLASEFNPLA